MRFTEFNDQGLTEGPNDPNIFKAVFMAGASGSGKSSVSRLLFNGTGLKPVNVDTIENYYRLKNKKVADRSELHQKRRAMRKNYLHGRLGLIIDGTGRDPKVINKTRRFLEAIGYETALVYVDVDLETSLRRVKSRAENPNSPDYGREIDPEKVKQINQDILIYDNENEDVAVERMELVPVLVKTVQQQNEKIEQVKKDLKKTQKENEKLKREIDKIKEYLKMK